jgi:hypothetical protein
VVSAQEAIFVMPPLSPFEMLEPRVDHFLDPVQLSAPGILRVVEPLINSIESSINVSPQIAQPRIVDENPHEYGDRGNTNGNGDLNGLISHRSLQNTFLTP